MKITDILRIGSLELIDRLIIITDGKDIWLLGIDREDTMYEAHLGFVRILEFIDHDELVLFREAHTDDIVSLDESYRFEDHIGEVDESTLSEDLLIRFEYSCKCFLFFHLPCFLQFTFSGIAALGPGITPCIHELRTPVSPICFPCCIETPLEQYLVSIITPDILL